MLNEAMRKTRLMLWTAFALAGVMPEARAANDTVRFYGTWQSTISANGQTVTIISVHDATGYHNSMVMGGDSRAPAGDGAFSAVDGRWTADAAKPNDSGTYRFIDDNKVICTNAIGQVVTWTRVNQKRPGNTVESRPAPRSSPAPAPPAYVPDPNLPPETNQAIEAFNRKDYNTAWRKFMEAAQKGDSEAQAGLGAMLFEKINPPGTGFYAQCEQWLLKSANQGNPKGMVFLARFYYADGARIMGGINPGVNTTTASPDERRIGNASFAKARMWFERAAQLGDGYAMGNLAIMLDAGVGGPADPERAKQLRAQVASHSDPNFAERVTKDPAAQALTAAWQAGNYADALRNAQAMAEK